MNQGPNFFSPKEKYFATQKCKFEVKNRSRLSEKKYCADNLGQF